MPFSPSQLVCVCVSVCSHIYVCVDQFLPLWPLSAFSSTWKKGVITVKSVYLCRRTQSVCSAVSKYLLVFVPEASQPQETSIPLQIRICTQQKGLCNRVDGHKVASGSLRGSRGFSFFFTNSTFLKWTTCCARLLSYVRQGITKPYKQ